MTDSACGMAGCARGVDTVRAEVGDAGVRGVKLLSKQMPDVL